MELSSLGPQLKQAGGQSQAYKILADEPYWEDVFKELGNTIPADIYLTELSMKNKTIKIRGLIVSEEKERLLSDFIRGLERGIFKKVTLVTTKEMKEKTANEFELKCRVD